MSKKLIPILLCCAITCAQEKTGDIAIDEIKAIVNDEKTERVITASDVTRRNFDGAEHTLQDVILETAKDMHAAQLGLSIENEDVDRYLRAMAQDKADMSKEALATTAQEHGYDTLEEFYNDLKRLYRANVVTDQEIKTMLTTSEQEIQNYYEVHPEYKEGVYYVQTANIPFSKTESPLEQEAHLNDSNKRSSADIDWQEPFDINYSEIAQNREFIKTMKIGDVHVVQTSNGFELYKLKNVIEKHLIPLEQRRKDIMKTVRDEKFARAYEQYNENILKDVRVSYCK